MPCTNSLLSSSSCSTNKALALELSSRVESLLAQTRCANHVRPMSCHSVVPPPVQSLQRGDWVKLICGASFEDVADVRNLSLVYTLAGVDCIDCAADLSVVNAVKEGIDAARSISAVDRPWIMISVNDDQQDLHFRKAEFDPDECPIDCTRPCETICPADAISLKSVQNFDQIGSKFEGGVKTERCYGCGRCLTICPFDRIRAITYVRDPIITCNLVKMDDVDALEIHTSGRGTELFKKLWSNLADSIKHVKLIAVSLPYVDDSTVEIMNEIYAIMQSSPPSYNLWQLDGRPMSGDIGKGATKETISFALQLNSTINRPYGFYQLAGGTNFHTIDSLKKEGLFRTKTGRKKQAYIGGIAFGGYARKIVGKILRKIPTKNGFARIEEHPQFLHEALKEVLALLGPIKRFEDFSV